MVQAAANELDARAQIVRALFVARSRARWSRIGEAALIGFAAACVAAVAARASGADGFAPADLAAAAVAALAASMGWWIEKRPSMRDTVRRVDRELARHGELVTVWELTARERLEALEELALVRAATQIDPARARRAIAPPSLALASAALLAAASLSWVRESAPTEFAGAAGGVASDSAAPRRSATAAAAARAQELARLEARLDAARDPSLAAREAQVEIQVVERELGRLARGADPGGADAQRIERALAAARELEKRTASDSAATNGGRSSDSAGDGLANGATDSTMSRLRSTNDAQQEGNHQASDPRDGASSDVRAGAGTIGGRWWSARYDSVVGRWLDACRARAERSENGTTTQRE